MRLRPFLALLATTTFAACDGTTPVEPRPAAAAAAAMRSMSGSLTASAVSATEIDLSWPSAQGAISGYQVFRSTTGVAGNYSLLAAMTRTSYADLSLTAATPYCYEVRSYKTAGRNITYSSFSLPACATTSAAPPPVTTISAPSGVDAVSLRHSYFVDAYGADVRLSWVDNSDNEDGFRIERASSATGSWSQSATAAANATSVIVGAARETLVCFRVVAFNSAAASNSSPVDCTIPPANPTNLASQPTSDFRALLLTWTDNSGAEDGYKVYRQEGSSAWTELAMLSANSTSFVEATAVPDISYVYRVVATRDGGLSDDSNLASGVIPTTLPGAATLALATLDSYSDGYGWVYLNIGWTDNASNEQGFRIEASNDGVSGWTTSGTVGANEIGYGEKWDLFGSMGAGACYRVVAFNPRGDASPSNVTCAEWGVAALNAVANAVNESTIALSWTDIARYEVGYVILRATSENGDYQVVAELPANSSSYTDAGLVSGTQYWYLIATIDESVPSDGSNLASATAITTSPSPLAVSTQRAGRLDRATLARVRATILATRMASARHANP